MAEHLGAFVVSIPAHGVAEATVGLSITDAAEMAVESLGLTDSAHFPVRVEVRSPTGTRTQLAVDREWLYTASAVGGGGE